MADELRFEIHLLRLDGLDDAHCRPDAIKLAHDLMEEEGWDVAIIRDRKTGTASLHVREEETEVDLGSFDFDGLYARARAANAAAPDPDLEQDC